MAKTKKRSNAYMISVYNTNREAEKLRRQLKIEGDKARKQKGRK